MLLRQVKGIAAKKMERLWHRLPRWLLSPIKSAAERPTGALPPERLRKRVAGNTDANHFHSSGRQSVDDYRLALSGIGRRFEDFERVLDFGCGCGRVMRWLGKPLRAQRDKDGLLFLPGEDVGLPDFYQTAYHATWYIQEHWRRHFNVLAHVERGALNYQDLLLLKRPRRTTQSG